jgi:glycosyltransferase involved in cell wall biosynthesis
MPIISIIVPVYKVEAYLRECLDSVTAQTFTDYECILIDDGSPDNCPAICDEYAAQYPQMKVIHKKNGGLSDARNTGIRSACGEWIVLLDSDDLFASKEALKDLANVMVKTNAPVIFNSNLTVFNENGCKVYDGIKYNFVSGGLIQFYKQIVRRKMVLGGWRFVCSRSFLIENKLFFLEGILHEDSHWIPRLICAAETIAVNHSLFYAYRVGRPGAITSTIGVKNVFDMIYILKEEQAWIKDAKFSGERLKVLKCLAASCWYCTFLYVKVLKTDDCRAYYQIISELNSLKSVLLGGRSIKYHLFYIVVSIIGIDRLLQLNRYRG